MRKYALFIFLTILCTYTSISQKTIFSYQPFAGASSKSNSYDSYIIHDKKNERTTVMFTNNKNVDYLLLNKDFVQEGILHPAASLTSDLSKAKWSRYYTGVVNNLGSAFFYGYSEKGKKFEIVMEVVDFNKKTVTNKTLFELGGGDQTVDWYTNEGSFIHLSVNDKAKEFVFRIVDINGKAFIKNIPVDISGLTKEKLALSEYFSYSRIFSPGDETELASATDLTKIYVYPDKLVMIVSNLNEPPHIWTIDTKSFKIVSKEKIDLSRFVGFSGQKEKAYNNSFLFGDNLYLLNTSKNKIEIGIFDFASRKLIKKHEITENSTIPFLETPEEVTTIGRKSKKNVINSNKELLKELFKGSTGIAVSQNENGEIILTSGVYDKETRSSGGYYMGGFTTASMPTGSIYAGSNVPVMRTYSNFNSMSNYRNSGRSYDYTRTVNFKTALHPTTFEIIKTNKKLSVIDKINTFIETIDDKATAENVFKSGNKQFVSYYLPDTRTFYIKEIKL